MDWVKNNAGGKKSKHRKGSGEFEKQEAGKPEPRTASDWFAELCQENIERLQESFSAKVAVTKGRKDEQPSSIEALVWGVHGQSPEDFGDPASLIAFATAYQAGDASPEFEKSGCKLAAWLNKQLPVHSEEPAVALSAVGWIYGLPGGARALKASEWIETLQSILSQVDRAWEQEGPESLLAWLIWSCEIPLALATQLSQLGGRDRVVSDTLDRLALCLEVASERAEAWLNSGAIYLRPLLASVIRCRWSADQIGARRWYGTQRKALTRLATLAISASGRDGRPILQDASLSDPDREFWPALYHACNAPEKLAVLLSHVFPSSFLSKSILRDAAKAKQPRKGSKAAKKPLAELGFHHEEAEVAWMRSAWERKGCRLGIHYGSDPIWLDVFDRLEERLMSGWWEVAVSKNGKPLDIDCGWSEVCWFTDDDVDYLELQCEVEGQCVIQRQAMLVRNDSFVYFADTLLGHEEADWTLETRFPLEPGVHFVQEDSTRDGALVREGEQGDRGWLFPVALPEWKRSPCEGELLQEGDCLTLVHRAHGKKLYSPLALAMQRRQADDGQTWRTLTVAEDLRIVQREEAAAYRVQTGKSQWVIYRSLAPTMRRTAVGLHINSEFYAGRFHRKTGEVDVLVEVDAE